MTGIPPAISGAAGPAGSGLSVGVAAVVIGARLVARAGVLPMIGALLSAVGIASLLRTGAGPSGVA